MFDCLFFGLITLWYESYFKNNLSAFKCTNKPRISWDLLEGLFLNYIYKNILYKFLPIIETIEHVQFDKTYQTTLNAPYL